MVSLGQVAELFLPPVSASADFQRSRVPAVGPCTGHRASAVDSRAPSPAEGVGDRSSAILQCLSYINYVHLALSIISNFSFSKVEHEMKDICKAV